MQGAARLLVRSLWNQGLSVAKESCGMVMERRSWAPGGPTRLGPGRIPSSSGFVSKTWPRCVAESQIRWHGMAPLPGDTDQTVSTGSSLVMVSRCGAVAFAVEG